MPPSPPEAPDKEPASRLVGILLLILLVGLPVLVVSGLFVRVGPVRVVDGMQPGGAIVGRVVDPEGYPVAGVNVLLWLAEISEDGSIAAHADEETAPVVTDADGRFELNVPPFEGHYEIVAEGDLWVGASKGVTFVDRDGDPYDPGEIELTIEPGCLLRLELVDETGAPLGNGDYTLTGKADTGPLFGLLGARRHSRGSIHKGVLEIGGVPPMEATISIHMDDGRLVEITLPLTAGIVRDRIAL